MSHVVSKPVILITGATGFVGTHLLTHLAERYTLVLVIRPDSTPPREPLVHDVIKYNGDIGSLIFRLKKLKVEGTIHLASKFVSEHQSVQVKELVDSNVRYGADILEACHCASVKWFINTGTFWQHYRNAPYCPVNFYAATKQAFEAIASYYIEIGKMSVVTLELSDTYGPMDFRPKLMPLWKKMLRNGTALDMSQGNQILDLCHIDDVCRSFVQLVKLLRASSSSVASGDSFVVKGDKRLSVRELAALVEKVTGKILHINWGAKPQRTREVMIPYEHGRTVPGWQPMVTLEDGIRQVFCDATATRGAP